MTKEERDATIAELAPSTGGEFNYAHQLLVKRRLYVDRFLAGEPFPPFEVEIQASSRCNLRCRWCIGHSIQRQNKVLHLPNNITAQNIHPIVDGILDCQYDGLGIDTVKFSGFIGEPLLVWDTIEPAIQRLVGAGLRVGVFTNGVLMGPHTWQTLANVAYVHISLDAGPNTFGPLKAQHGQHADGYKTVLANIAGLHRIRGDAETPRLNVGYIMVPWNVCEMQDAMCAVDNAGADSIRFKADVTGQYDLTASEAATRQAFEAIAWAKENYADDTFAVHVIHNADDVVAHTYSKWQPVRGCSYQHFCASVGSDGNLYLCDFNTMPGGVPLGNVINTPFKDVWDSPRRQYLAQGVRQTCQSPVCPPFGNAANLLLAELKEKM